MKNKILFIILFASLFLFGCTNEPEEPETVYPEDTIAFLEAVENIEFSLDSKGEIDHALDLYDALGENSWNFDEVLEAFDLLIEYEQLLKERDAALHFITLVEDIPYLVTLDSKNAIDAAFAGYSLLSDDAKKFLEVDFSYQVLLASSETYKKIEKENNKITDQVMISEFKVLVDKIPSLETFVLEDLEHVIKAEEYYESLTDTAKADNTVITLYEKVTSARLYYEEVVNNPAVLEEAAILKFIESVNALPSVEDITLESLDLIVTAESNYISLSEEAKAQERVMTSNATLILAREKYDTLYALKEEEDRQNAIENQIIDFVNMVNALPSVSEVKVSDGTRISDAKLAYDELPNTSKEDTRVEEAYQKITALQVKFDTFTLTKITFNLMNLIPTGDGNGNVELQGATMGGYIYPQLRTLYNVSSNTELAKCVDLYFYLYLASETNPNNYVASFSINDVLKSSSTVVQNGIIVGMLKEASRENELVVTGSYKFGISVIDKKNLFDDSDIFMGTGSYKYTFDSLYGVIEDNTVIEISSKEEFLAIKDNLSGNYALTADIDLENMEWENLGKFSGTLDGRGHKVYNIAHNNLEGQFGLFLEVLYGAKVSRLILEGTILEAGVWSGAICVRNYGLIENCIINLDVSAAGSEGHIGGISTDNNGTILNCLVLSKINGQGTLWGNCSANLVINNNGTIMNCYASLDNSLTDKTIHAPNGTVSSCGSYTNAELKSISLYANWDRTIWNISNGALPTLIVE